MGIIAENNQWYKGRQEIAGEYSDEYKKVSSAIAGRNFIEPPGFFFEATTKVEEVAKIKLSALNYKIVSDATERELKQTGHTYTQIYKAARIAFELNKQTLLTDLQQEFADLDAIQSLKKEELDRLFVELDIRRIILTTTKTTIELEMEQAKRDLSETDRLTFGKETELINEQVVTATKKLEVLPYIQSIIDTEQQILSQEQQNAPFLDNLIAEKQSLINKKNNEILPLLTERAVEALALSIATIASIPIEKQIMTQRVDEANSRCAATTARGEVVNAEIAVNALREALSAARTSLQEAKITRQINLNTANASNIVSTAANHTAMTTSKMTDNVLISSSNIAADSAISGSNMLGQEQSVELTTGADKSSIDNIARHNAQRVRRVANVQAVADITSRLIHLIGS